MTQIQLIIAVLNMMIQLLKYMNKDDPASRIKDKLDKVVEFNKAITKANIEGDNEDLEKLFTIKRSTPSK